MMWKLLVSIAILTYGIHIRILRHRICDLERRVSSMSGPAREVES